MITILCEGKAKQSYIKEGIQEYMKRLQKYTTVKYEEGDIGKAKGYVVALTPFGKEISSEEFAEWLNKVMLREKQITFIIGGAEGIPKEVLGKSQYKLSLSKMTFQNELVRVVFLEQLYRGFTIIKNEPYHK